MIHSGSQEEFENCLNRVFGDRSSALTSAQASTIVRFPYAFSNATTVGDTVLCYARRSRLFVER
jgi:hypothetical protein